MTEKNPRIQKWLEKFNQFLREVHATDKLRTRRLREEKRSVLETQMIRHEIVMALKELYELALHYAKTRRAVKEKEKWARLAAYIAQTINTIIDSYDEVMIEQTLDELEQYVKLHIEED